MPVIIDRDPGGTTAPITVIESAAILLYLAEKVGRFLPVDTAARFAAIKWLVWQAANFGPKVGETNHFRRLEGSQGDQSYALRRFDDETNRLYGVLNNRLSRSDYLGGHAYGIADMAAYPLTVNWQAHGQNLADFDYVARWLDVVGARPAVGRGMAAGSDMSIPLADFTPEMKRRYQRVMLNQRAIPVRAAD